MANLQRVNQGRWDSDFEPELRLLGGIIKQAVKDAKQTANGALRREAWEFLEVCAPTVAERLIERERERG